eukprot:39855-Amphidinium_carterae.1
MAAFGISVDPCTFDGGTNTLTKLTFTPTFGVDLYTYMGAGWVNLCTYMLTPDPKTMKIAA